MEKVFIEAKQGENLIRINGVLFHKVTENKCASENMRKGVEMENKAMSVFDLTLARVRPVGSPQYLVPRDNDLAPNLDIMMGVKAWNEFKNHPLVRIGKLDGISFKQKTRYISFQFEGRTITLAGKNKWDKVEVGYSVYCDHMMDKRKSAIPKPDLSEKIALGRLDKKPLYSVDISEETHRFIDATLHVAKAKILKGELIIKGIR